MGKEKEIWVLAEQREGRLARITLELLGKAAELCAQSGAKVASVLVGSGVAELSTELAAYGAEKIYLIEDHRLAYYQSEAYASTVADTTKNYEPEIFLMGYTDIGKDLAPRVAAKLGTGLTAHCVDLKIEENEGMYLLSQIVPASSGDQMINIVCPRRRPQMATVKPGVFDVPPRKEGMKSEIIRVPVQISGKHFRAETIEVKEQKPVLQPLEESEIVIAAGWGVYSLGSLQMVTELAEILGGVLGGTRPLVDKGWIPKDCMIGQSGKAVSPKLLVSLGASGAMHFTTGFERAKFVIAIDQNPEAPIFRVADIGIVGDLREVLPCLISELKKLR